MMRFSRFGLISGAILFSATAGFSAAFASETPLYQPAPAWVLEAPAIDPAKPSAGSPLVVYDVQQRLEGDHVWSYVDTAFRADTPDALTQLGTLTASWSPDKGDLIIHRAQIIRAGEVIDILAGGKFDVLRREQQLERRTLDGELTSTMVVPGLRVGDIVRLSMSTTQADKALSGNVQSGSAIVAQPFKADFARLRFLWPANSSIRWQAGPRVDVPASAQSVSGGFKELIMPVPIAKRPDMPADAPTRYRSQPWFQIGSFASWEAVSKVMAPLFATDGLIASGTPLSAEVATIAAASADPLERTARALELVQGKIAYLAIFMNGGNYVPQTPAKTWELRYGDCKAKTLLLLSILRGLGIDAEAVLARSQGGDSLPGLLPMPADFDHVLVHARVGGQDLWLDGTSLGSRQADLADAPPFFHVLPLRMEGSGLLAIAPRANVRPNLAVTLVADQRAGVDLPTVFDISLAFRGAEASQLNTQWVQTNPSERSALLNGMLQRYVGQSQLASQSFSYDDRTSIATVTGRGVSNTGWKSERGALRYPIELMQSQFEADRARPAWRDIPVASEAPVTRTWNTRYLLPEGGKGFAVDGDAAVSGMFGGAQLERRGEIANGIYTLAERIDQTGAEIAPANINAEKARVAAARAATVALVAPADTRRRWQYGDTAGRALLAPIEQILASAIAASPDKPDALESRAAVHALVLDWRSAALDLDRAIAIEPRARDYLTRSEVRENLGDLPGALRDAVAAQQLDPASAGGIGQHASVLAQMGRHDDAAQLLQTRIDAAGEDRFQLIAAQAEHIADSGKPDDAIALLDKAIIAKPGDPVLLNARCWIKGTHSMALDTALRDCTKAIELTENSAGILDSRAMVYFRMGRLDDALADYDAALSAIPGLGPSMMMRGLILKRTGHIADGQSQIDQAIRLSPTVLARFKRYGIEP